MLVFISMKRARPTVEELDELESRIDTHEIITHEDAEQNPQLTELPEWKLEMLDPIDHPAILMLGKRRTGKSFFTRWMMEHMKDRFDHGLIITETRFNGFWQKHFPDSHIHEVYRPEMIQAVLCRQAKITDMENSGEAVDVRKDIFILFDDVMGVDENTMRYDGTLTMLLTAGRHFGITVIFCLQDTFGVPPKIRNNIDIAVILKQQQKRNVDAIYENWFSLIYDKKTFNALLASKTKDRHVIVVDSSGAVDEDNMVYNVKAKEPKDENFKLCAPLWEAMPNIHPNAGKLSREEQEFRKYHGTADCSQMFTEASSNVNLDDSSDGE